jgi:hypothetical protein
VNMFRRAAEHKDEEVRERENELWRNRWLVPGVRENEVTNRAAARKDEKVRERENEQRRNRRSVPGVRENEATNRATEREDEEVRERENEQQRNRRSVPGVQENESTNRAAARAKRTYDMACTYKNGEFRFGQLWFMEHTVCAQLRIHPPFEFNAWDEEEVLCKWPHVN